MANFEKEAKIQAWILFGPVGIGTLMALLVGFQVNVLNLAVILISMLGAWLIIKSKVTSKQRSKQPIEWGSASMTSQERRSYRIGWGMLSISVVISLLLKYGGL